MRKVIFCLGCLFLSNFAFGQKQFIRDYVLIQYQDSALGSPLVSDIDNRNFHMYILNGIANDSIDIFVNDKAVFSGRFHSGDKEIRQISFRKYKRKLNVIKVYLHEKKSFVEFVCDTRYEVLKLDYYKENEKTEPYWSVTYSHFVPDFK